jgi:TfoX/Sxy family transcriptional regulator of competence genes
MTPTWEKSSPELVALFTELAPRQPAVVEKQMFGWPCCLANGNLFFGLHKELMLFRLSDADCSALLKVKGAAVFEPMAGRRMKNYVTLADAVHRDHGELTRWVGRSLEFALSLPPRAKTKTKAKTKPAARKRKG